ncbi:MAG: Jag N-terminal domain-containing protein [Eubacteriales bacterium]|nr:Jag N-terminal domain-containing protein [Eubacteriales bacterium]
MSQEYIEITERTVSEAITVACQKLAVPSERLEYEVIDPGKTGFLGIGSRAARIRARVKKGMQESTEIDTSAIISGVLKGEEKREEISEPVRNTGKKEKNHPGVNREKKEAPSEKARKPERAEKEEKPDNR